MPAGPSCGSPLERGCRADVRSTFSAYSEDMRNCRLAGAVAVAWLLAAIPSLRAEEAVEDLAPGLGRERLIAAGETHGYRVEVGNDPVLLVVEQRGINLEMEALRAAGQEPLSANSLSGRWGPEILVLAAETAGSRTIEVRAPPFVMPGLYSIRAELLPQATEREARQVAALRDMSRAGQLAPGSVAEKRQALSFYREALAAWRSLGEIRWEAEAQYQIAELERALSDWRPAAEDLLRAAALWKSLSELDREAASLVGLGSVRARLGETKEARETLEKGSALWRSLGNHFEEGAARMELCLLEQTSGDLATALSCHKEILELFRALGAPRQAAATLNSIGGIYDLLGEPDAALDRYNQALAYRREQEDRHGEAQTLINIAVVHRSLGEWQEALRVYSMAREIFSAVGDRAQEATLLNNIGFTYDSLGEPQRALAFLQQALKLRQELGDRRGEIITLNNLGLAWRSLGDLETALDHHRRALESSIALGDRRQEAMSRLRLGEAQVEKGAPSAALGDLEQAGAYLEKTGDRRRQVEALHLRGRALALAGRPPEALPVLQQTLARRQALRDRAGEAETLHALALAERSLGQIEEARMHAEAAVAKVEELRSGFVSSDLRASFLATRRRAYSLVIDLLMDRHASNPQEGHDWKAFVVSERARARSLIDVLHSGSRAGGTVPAELIDRRRSLRRRLSAKADQQVKQSGERAEALAREIDALLTDLESLEAEIRRHDPQYAALREPPSVNLLEIALLLDPGTLLLEYSLGEEKSFLWTVGAGGLRSFVLPPRREMEALARQAYEELSTVEAGSGGQKAAEALSRILLSPVWSEAADFHRLIVIPDAALHILPFGALPVPEPGRSWDKPGVRKPLLEFEEVVYVPSATTLSFQRQRLAGRAPAPKWAAVLADPVFSRDDPRLTNSSASKRLASVNSNPVRGGGTDSLLPVFERLPSSQSEAEWIAKLAPAGQVWTASGLDANRTAALSGELRNYRIVHFATHAIADARNPELSGLMLSLVDAAGHSREGFLSLTDIYDLDLSADLVALSGCRTAIGKEVRGEGLLGLTRGFLYAGVPRVVASLWPVQDRTTAELMARFYRAMWKDRLSPAAALRQAQRSLRSEPRYRDPYSWAGFVLQGDWR